MTPRPAPRSAHRTLGLAPHGHGTLATASAALALAMLASPVAAQDAPPLKVSGFVEAAYAVTSRDVARRIVGNLYLTRHDEFVLEAAMVRVERPLPTAEVGTGFVVEAMAGAHAQVIRAVGLDLGVNADVVQAYGSISVPRAGLVFSAGKMPTMLGYEVIQSVSNPNLSVGHQFAFAGNFTDLGLDVAWTGPAGWSVRGRVANGWDVVRDNNRSKTVFGKLGWSGGGRSFAVLGYSGRELSDAVDGRRSGVELLGTGAVGRLTAAVQLDLGREEETDTDWRAAGLWLGWRLAEGWELALRGDALDDMDGARTSGVVRFPGHSGQTLTSATATIVIRAVPGALIRPELRYDHSDLPVFAGYVEQWTAALGAAWTF